MAINQYTNTIKNIFDQLRIPLSANEILINLNRKGMKPNKTTVYRTLSFLTNSGYLKQILVDSNTCYYEKAANHHHHFFCTACKGFEDLDPDLASETKIMDKLQGKKVLFHTLEFFGLCEKCQNKK